MGMVPTRLHDCQLFQVKLLVPIMLRRYHAQTVPTELLSHKQQPCY